MRSGRKTINKSALTSVAQDAIDGVFSPWVVLVHFPLHNLIVILFIITNSAELWSQDATDCAHFNRKGEIKMFRIGRDVSASTIVNSKKEFGVKFSPPLGYRLFFSISAVFSRTQEKVSDLRERCSCHRCHLSVTCLGFPSWTFPGFLFYTPRFSCPTPERRFASIGRKKKMCHLISQNICTRNGSEKNK